MFCVYSWIVITDANTKISERRFCWNQFLWCRGKICGILAYMFQIVINRFISSLEGLNNFFLSHQGLCTIETLLYILINIFSIIRP
jgi:hypothetical protein